MRFSRPQILVPSSGLKLSLYDLEKLCSTLQVFLFQKAALYKCNMAGKPAVVTRVVDSMTDNLRPTRAEATDVANAVLDGALFFFLSPTSHRSNFWLLTILPHPRRK